jgi:hypothetical protein
MQVAVEKTAETGVQATDCFDNNADCVCPADGSRLVAKSEALKLKKQIAAISLVNSFTLITKDAPRHPAVLFSKPHYLSDSFHDLAPKRGPPSFLNKGLQPIH